MRSLDAPLTAQPTPCVTQAQSAAATLCDGTPHDESDVTDALSGVSAARDGLVGVWLQAASQTIANSENP
jgi:hypothetical protein